MNEPDKGWTIETLRLYLESLVHESKAFTDQRFAERDLRYQQRFDATEKAVSTALDSLEKSSAAALAAADRAVMKAEVAAEKRFESVNEFRNTLKDQQTGLMPRAEAMVIMQAMSDKIVVLMDTVTRIQGKGAGLNAFWGYFVAVATLALISIGILVAFLTRH